MYIYLLFLDWPGKVGTIAIMDPSPAGTAAPSPYASGGSSQATKYDRTMDIDAAFEGTTPPAGGGASRQHRQLFRVDSIAPMVAPVTTRRRVRSARLPHNPRPYLSSQSLVECSTPRSVLGRRFAGDAGARGIEEEEKFPLPDNPDIWAHYGFIDGSLIPERHHRDDASSRGSGRRGEKLVRLMSDPGGGRRQASEEGREGAEEPAARDYPASDSIREAPAAAAASPAGSDSHTALRSNSAAADVGRQRPAAGPRALSSELGSTTPPTVILTPSSQERCKPTGALEAAAPVRGAHTGLALDSMAAAAAAAAATAAAAAASSASEATATPAATPGGKLRDERAPMSGSEAEAEAAQQLEETKDEELMALRQEEEQEQGHHQQQRVMATKAAVTTDPASSDAALARASWSFSSMEGAEEGAPRATQQPSFADRNAARRRPPRSMAEVERHKRNRAERLRAYGCQRTLYPRIVPGSTSTGGGSASGSASGSGSSGCPATEEMETVLWVDTLRVSAALRGESLMAACTVNFVESSAATLLQERQSEARASRTADVSEMEGPDGLLHCSVLKGDHALAARAAQFLVDKRGASVNSRDAWGR